jgi:Protein of unknown function (DUF2281)
MIMIIQQIIAETETLPPQMHEQVLNFVQFLKYKSAKAEQNQQDKNTDELRMSNNE